MNAGIFVQQSEHKEMVKHVSFDASHIPKLARLGDVLPVQLNSVEYRLDMGPEARRGECNVRCSLILDSVD